jgi:hypothetical protein
MSTFDRSARVALSAAAFALASMAQAATPAAPQAPPAATRAAAVAVTKITPEDGAKRVDVLDPVQIKFDGAIDPASVTRAHVVIANGGVTIGSTLAYDDAMHRITLKPVDWHGAMEHGSTYTVVVSGLVDASGHAVPSFRSSFSTWTNQTATVTSMEDGGVVDFLVRFERPSGARSLREVSYGAPGADGQWGTADDVVVAHDDYKLRADGREARDTRYGSPGTDGAWFTGDDGVDSWVTDTYLPNGAPSGYEIHYSASFDEACCGFRVTYGYDADGVFVADTAAQPGPDGVLGTADDDVVVTTYRHDALGRYIGGEHRTNGVLTSYQVRTWQADRRLACDESRGLGPDGVAYTADDAVLSVLAFTYDKRGNVIRTTTYRDPGPDGVWHTADDVPTRYTRNWLDDHDNVVRSSRFFGPGPDGVWFTADDLALETSTHDTSR